MKKTLLMIFITSFLFSTIEISLKPIGLQIDPFQINLTRTCLGVLVLLPFVLKELKQREIHLGKKDWAYFCLLGFLNIIGSMSFLQLAIVYAEASIVAIIFCANPVFTVLFSKFILKNQMSLQKWLALLICVAGLLVILNPLQLSMEDAAGMILALMAAICFALYSTFAKIKMDYYGGILETGMGLITGGGFLLLFFLFTQRPINFDLTASEIMILLYVGVVATGIGFLLYFLIIEQNNPETASVVFFLKPVIAPILAILILGDKILFNEWIGICLIIVGSYFNLNKKALKMNNKGEEL